MSRTYDRDGQVIPDDYYNASKYPRGQAKWGTEQRVGRTQVGDFIVSTVWLFGIDHSYGPDSPPIIFETMVFGEPYENDLTRYATEEQAMRGHLATVDALRAGQHPFSWKSDDDD
jgi:hypothetical protein